jgi:hypothetical protein
MKHKTLVISIIFGLYLVTAITGCDHGHSHSSEHSHENVNQDSTKKSNSNSTTHDAID